LKGGEIKLQSSSLGFEENWHELGLKILLRISNTNSNEASPEAMLLCRHHRPHPQIQQFRVIPGEDSSKCATE